MMQEATNRGTKLVMPSTPSPTTYQGKLPQDWTAPLSCGLTPPPIPLFNGADAGVGVRVINTALFQSAAKPDKAAE